MCLHRQGDEICAFLLLSSLPHYAIFIKDHGWFRGHFADESDLAFTGRVFD